MVANTRKTPGAGPLRSVKTGAAKQGRAKAGAAKPGAVSQDMQFRSLNLPVPIEVVEDSSGRPEAVVIPSTINNRPTRARRPAQQQLQNPKPATQKITAINDLWQVNDEWWRERPISRRYYQITTQNDRRLTVFQDDLNGTWYWQKGGS